MVVAVRDAISALRLGRGAGQRTRKRSQLTGLQVVADDNIISARDSFYERAFARASDSHKRNDDLGNPHGEICHPCFRWSDERKLAFGPLEHGFSWRSPADFLT